MKLAILGVADGSADLGPHLDDDRRARFILTTGSTIASDAASSGCEWSCIASPAVRLTSDGLARTLHAISEPSVVDVADGLIHRSVFVLLEGRPPTTREIYRLTLGDTAKGPSPTVVLGGAMTQPGALVVRTQWLVDNIDVIESNSSIEMVEKATRILGQNARLLVMPWILSERVVVRDSNTLDLGDALGIDPRYQYAMSELWRHAWADVDAASVDHVRLVHGIVAPKQSVSRRLIGGIRRLLGRR